MMRKWARIGLQVIFFYAEFKKQVFYFKKVFYSFLLDDNAG